MLGVEGPFTAQQEIGLSAFHIQMERIGLPITTVKAVDFHVLRGQEGLGLTENVRTPSWPPMPGICCCLRITGLQPTRLTSLG